MTDETTIRNQIKNAMQKQTYHYCDNLCGISAFECGARYGDVNKCTELQEYYKRQRKEYNRAHGLVD